MARPDPELLIVGAGAAGVSAALWARSHDLGVAVLESAERPGGQLQLVNFQPRDIAGVRVGAGAGIAAVYAEQLRDAAVPVRFGVAATALESDDGGRPAIATAAGERLAADAVLIATGARRRRLDVPGERELEDRGVSYSATRDRERLKGRRVAVVGGGDAAFENALILVAAGCEVTLVVRGAPRARREFRDRVAAEPRITTLADTRVTAMLGTGALEGLDLTGPGGESRLAVEGVVIKVGDVPNTEWCRGAVGLDGAGYVAVDARHRTSRRRVWAAGDVTRPPLPSIAVAVGAGALAASDVRAELRKD